MKKFLYIIMMLTFVLTLLAEEKLDKNYRLVGFPFGFYKPETSFALGFGGGLYFRLPDQDDSYNTSEIALAGFYSFKNYYSVTLKPDIYLNLYNLRVLTTLKFENNDGSYFGIGPLNTKDDEIIYRYQQQQMTFEISNPSFFIDYLERGLIIDYSNFKMKDIKDSSFVQYPFINEDYKYQQLGLGFRMDYDRRDDIHFPTDGYYAGIRYVSYRKDWNSDYEFNNLIFDIRKYFPLKGNQTIANQLYSGNISHNAPFMFLSSLGGSEIMRGYYEGRFRDRNSLVYQLEYRNMFTEKWGAVAFANFGTVYSRFEDIERKDIIPSFGIGGRYKLIPEDNINLRLDLAKGRNSFGFYFLIEEAF